MRIPSPPHILFVSLLMVCAALARADEALIRLMTQPGYGLSVPMGEPELVVLLGQGERPAAWAWQVRIEDASSRLRNPRSFFIETRTGQVLHVQDEFFGSHSGNDVTGVVRGWASPGTLPNIPCGSVTPCNDPALMPLPGIEVRATVNGTPVSVFTGSDGMFTVPVSQSGATVVLEASLGPTTADGGWHAYVMDFGYFDPTPPGTVATCENSLETALSTSMQVTSPATIMLDFPSQSPHNDHWIAQTNAFLHIYRAREYIVDRTVTDAPILTERLQLVVNSTWNECPQAFPQACGVAGVRTTWYPFSSCRNSAYSSILIHEYGHIVDSSLGIPSHQSFTEGFADTLSILALDDAVFGREYLPEQNLREDPVAVRNRYPQPAPNPACSSVSYAAGQVLSGVWTGIRNRHVAEYGADVGLERVRQLHVDWMHLTTGGNSGCDAAHPGTVVELLSITAAADKGFVCDAFAYHDVPDPTGDCP